MQACQKWYQSGISATCASLIASHARQRRTNCRHLTIDNIKYQDQWIRPGEAARISLRPADREDFYLRLLFEDNAISFYVAEVWHDHTFHTTVPGTRAHGHVSGLRPAVTYQFRMYADNELGRSQASDVGIGPGISKSNPSLVRALVSSPPRIKTIGAAACRTVDRYQRVKKGPPFGTSPSLLASSLNGSTIASLSRI